MTTNSDYDYDIAVIGAGAAGLSAAYFLSDHASVAVLEAESAPAYHSSGRSAAMYIEGYENHVVRNLTQLGHKFFFSPTEGFSDTPLVTPSGGLTVAGPGEAEQLQKYLQSWQSLCPELVAISPSQAREIVPILRSDWVTAAAYDPSWQDIDVHTLLQGYQRGLKHSGGKLLTDFAVDRLEAMPDGWQIGSGDQQIKTKLVVNAAGAWANQIAEYAGIAPLPLTPMRRTAAIVPAPADCQDWPLLHTVKENLYFKPESPGLMVCPQDETPSPAMDAYPHDIDIALAMEEFQRVADYEVQRVMHSWAGLRTFTPDRYPAVGFDPLNNGFFWLAGQGGFGIQTSPGLGSLAANLILGRSAEGAAGIINAISAARFTNN
jgi:D-arginine dehydrogenase